MLDILKKEKKGISGVITAVIMVALAMVAVIIVWGVVVPLIKNQLSETESCFGVSGKVTINNMYTCYNSTSENFQFSITIKDIDVEKVLVAVSSKGETKSYTLNNSLNSDLIGYEGGTTTIPSKNSGKTYIASGFSEKPDLIQISPVVNGKTCEPTDSLSEIDNCLSLAW